MAGRTHALKLEQAVRTEQFALARELLKEYASSLGFDLCFQGFEHELAGIEVEYGPPTGRLLLAVENDGPAGCVAFRQFAPGVCEMKRLYVRTGFRGRGIGRRLCEAIVAEARGAGYSQMRLDTVPWMTEALALYESLGFKGIPPYRPNPISGARYLELRLIPA